MESKKIHENNTMCKCGHEYVYHVDPKTGKVGECLFSYNCDCKIFEKESKDD